MERHIRDYFAACNTGVPERIAEYFEPDGVHYFPPGMYGGPFRGAMEIGRRWQAAVEKFEAILKRHRATHERSRAQRQSFRHAGCHWFV